MKKYFPITSTPFKRKMQYFTMHCLDNGLQFQKSVKCLNKHSTGFSILETLYIGIDLPMTFIHWGH